LNMSFHSVLKVSTSTQMDNAVDLLISNVLRGVRYQGLMIGSSPE